MARPTIVVAGALANKPLNGGEAWVRLSWVRGLQRLGFQTFLFEQLDAGTCSNEHGEPSDVEGSVNLRYFEDVVRDFDLGGRAGLVVEAANTFGLSWDRVQDIADDAVLLVNISGNLRLPALLKRFQRRAYVDIDPGFTHHWHDTGAALGLEDHELHFTIGENIGQPDCPIPVGGVRWLPARQPVVLDDWPVVPAKRQDVLTTVAAWRGPYGPVDRSGRVYPQKLHEFRKMIELPRLVSQRLEIALSIDDGDSADRERLEERGWLLVDPKLVAGTPAAFRDFVQRSGGEFSVAQGVYVETRSGWFSDRTVRYLASGRPALVQDSGFAHARGSREGLITFSTLEEAAAGAARLAADPRAHCEAARALATDHFASDVVLPRFLEQAGING